MRFMNQFTAILDSSILVLFLIYIDDIVDNIYSEILYNADINTSLLKPITSPIQVITEINEVLETFEHGLNMGFYTASNKTLG